MKNNQTNQKEMAEGVFTHPRPLNYPNHRLLLAESFDSADESRPRRAGRSHGPATLDGGEPLFVGRAHVRESRSIVVGEPARESFQRLHDWRNRRALGSGLVHLVVRALGVRPVGHDIASVVRRLVLEPAITEPLLNLFLVVGEGSQERNEVALVVLGVFPVCGNHANFSAHRSVLLYSGLMVDGNVQKPATNIAYSLLEVKSKWANRKSPYFRAFSGISYWIKNSSSPQTKSRIPF